MKQYVISEEGLKEFFKPKLTFYERIIDDFLKSKKPVEEVANGEVHYDCGFCYVGKTHPMDVIDKFEGKSIKIFIQKSAK